MPAVSGSEKLSSPVFSLAFVLRSLALFVILFQFRLIAGDLADTPVFTATLLCAFIAPCVLAVKNIRTLPACAALALAPWAARLIVAVPGFPVSGLLGLRASAVLDGLLLNLDRNNFAALPFYYWAAFGAWFSLRSRRFLRVDISAGMVLLLGFFCVARSRDIDLYRWPVVATGVFAVLGFTQLNALMFSLPPEYRPRRRESIPAAAVLFLLVLCGGLLFLKPYQEKAVDQGGGLLEPKLFSFDFSRFIRLESEISMNRDLVLIVKKDPRDSHIFLRRYVLSGYHKKQGFYRLENPDEKEHPRRLPASPLSLEAPGPEEDARFRLTRITSQEYYLVNLDPSAFIGMNRPVSISPLENWDSSSFSSVYTVESRTSEALPFELMDAAGFQPPAPENLGLGREEYRIYTEYGGDERLRLYAEEICRGLTGYWDKVQSIYEWLKYGDYRYSLKPGIAPDGDQLGYFLFTAKKGYCSYYAFSFALLLRSLGIPARIGAGFALDPETNAFDYYPVRSDMAHTWVEVWFPGYGWIEYDPTTESLAEGEEFVFSSGFSPQLFERLMKEILENHSRLRAKEGGRTGRLDSLVRGIGGFFRARRSLLLILLAGVLWFLIRCGPATAGAFTLRPRGKAGLLWLRGKRLLRLAGYRRPLSLGEAEWAREMDGIVAGIYPLYQGRAAARFAPEFGPEDLAALLKTYRSFTTAWRGTVPPGRRLLAWVFPPAALVLGPSGERGRPGWPGGAGILLFLVIPFLIPGDRVWPQDTSPEAGQGTRPGSLEYGEQNNSTVSADTLLDSARKAEEMEFWERAVELYNQGIKQYPGDIRFPWALGNFYNNRGLYGLAREGYLKAEKLAPWDPDVLFRLSQIAAYLNLNTSAVEYLEKLLSVTPDNRDAIGSLGWMYFKVHRLADGERLLSGAVERFGKSPDYAMTLGTINAGMFRYEEAKKWYREVIADAEVRRDSYSLAVANYNLSILETRFYRFALAFERTDASLIAQDRPPGRLARGELYLRQLDFRRSLADYQAAYESDTSPLSKLNLARVYRISGRLGEARLYAEDCLESKDLFWMVNYGTDPIRYRRDIHEVLSETYEGLEKTEKLLPRSGIAGKLRGFFTGVSHRFNAAVHRHLFRRYSLDTADSYREKDPDALIQYYYAFQAYPYRVRKYLREARELETGQIAGSLPFYLYEEGRLLKDPALLRRALGNQDEAGSPPGFDPRWERDMIARTYRELAKLSRGTERDTWAEKLYALNRGGLRQQGISLPVNLRINPGETGPERRLAKALERMLKKAGLKSAGKRPVETGGIPRFTLILELGKDEGRGGRSVLCEVYDTGRSASVLSRNISLASPSEKDLATFVRTLAGAVFGQEF
jgi:transglutaminase-like putative cysteine protease/cytochrome c-type biogenesis protein CcmH/NrfG